MSLVSDRCICLRKVEYSETSQILLLFRRSHGLGRVIAKGAHRVTKTGASKFGGGIDLLDLGEAVFTHRPEKDLATLTEWKLREGHLDLRRTLRGMHLAFYAAELVGLLIEEHDPHPDLFDKLEQVLLELAGPRVEQAFLAFELDLLKATGYLPSMDACISCGTGIDARSAAAFEAARGGILCRNCEAAFPHRLPIDGRLLGVVQYILRLQDDGSLRRLPHLTRAQTDPINQVLAGHLEHTLDRRLKMPKHILASRQTRVLSPQF
jgi:DNA repair protein RecO (recombination protein O)